MVWSLSKSSRYRPLAGVSCIPPIVLLSGSVWCYRPLAGVSCIRDRLQGVVRPLLPSPCGGELHHLDDKVLAHCTALPSPCGGELHPANVISSFVTGGYRPLAGVSCIQGGAYQVEQQIGLPSPCGGELHPGEPRKDHSKYKLPSPCGGELHQLSPSLTINIRVTVPLRG